MEDYNEYIATLSYGGKLRDESYYLNGKRHRLGKPARIYYKLNGKVKFEDYFLYGKFHREDGPAIINYSDIGGKLISQHWYFLFGIQVTEKDFNTPGFVDAFILEHS